MATTNLFYTCPKKPFEKPKQFFDFEVAVKTRFLVIGTHRIRAAPLYH